MKMFDYSKLLKNGTFYIEFDSCINLDNYLVEDLIRYWYRQWFKKYTEVNINWINLNAFSIKSLVQITIDLNNCVSSNYVLKRFIDATKLTDTSGDRRRSLSRILIEGVNSSSCKLAGISYTFDIVIEYKKLPNDIPNPYLVSNFNLNDINELTELLTKLIDKEDKRLNQLASELDTSTKYMLMRQQLDKIEKLEQILKLASEL